MPMPAFSYPNKGPSGNTTPPPQTPAPLPSPTSGASSPPILLSSAAGADASGAPPPTALRARTFPRSMFLFFGRSRPASDPNSPHAAQSSAGGGGGVPLSAPASGDSRPHDERGSLPLTEAILRLQQRLRRSKRYSASDNARVRLASTESTSLSDDSEKMQTLRRTTVGYRWQEYAERLIEEGKAGKIHLKSDWVKVRRPEVFVKVKVNGISSIDLNEKSYEVDLNILLDWIDPSVIDQSGLAVILNPDIERDHFTPCVTISNFHGDCHPDPLPGGNNMCRLQEKKDKSKGSGAPDGKAGPRPSLEGAAVLSPRPGHVKQTIRYRARIKIDDAADNLKCYPFDTQKLQIKLKGDHIKLTSTSLANDEASNPRSVIDGNSRHHITVNKDASGQPRLGQWQILDFLPDTRPEDGKSKKDLYKSRKDELVITLLVRRNDPTIKKVFIQYYLCLALSVASFFLDSVDLNGRLGIIASVLLAFVSFDRSKAIENLPYWTFLDKFQLNMTYLTLAEAIAHVLICAIPNKNRKDLDQLFQCANATEIALQCKNAAEAADAAPPINSALFAHDFATSLYKFSHSLYFVFFFLFFFFGSKRLKTIAVVAGGLREKFLPSFTRFVRNFVIVFINLVAFFSFVTEKSLWESAKAVFDFLCALVLYAAGRHSDETNPYICRSEVLDVFQLVLSDNVLKGAVFALILHSQSTFWLDVIATLHDE